MDARLGGPAAKREPSPEGLRINAEDDPSAVGAAQNLGPLAPVSLGAKPSDLRLLFLLRPRPPLEFIRPRTLRKCIGAELRLAPDCILIHRADDPVTPH